VTSTRTFDRCCAGGDPRACACAGFSVIELILGLALTLCLALAVAPLWLSIQAAGAREGDQTVRLLQARVAVARFERDLRLASAAGCPFSLSGPVLAASGSQVVFLERGTAGTPPILVEWEIVNGALMRRRGVCPLERPAAFSHSLYVDNKTMLEGVKPGSVLSYFAGGVAIDPSAGVVDLSAVDTVVVELQTAADGAIPPVRVTARGLVGR
jgi:type II secretory pathway pseudopilin PulG